MRRDQKPRMYICKETFLLDEYDDDGFYTGDEKTIQCGTMFEREETTFRVAGGQDTVRLIAAAAGDGTWLELTEGTLAMYFDEVTGGTE